MPFAYDQMMNGSISTTFLIEYSDELFINRVDVEYACRSIWQAFDLRGLEKLSNLEVQALCHLCNGASVRNNIAYYLQQQIPSPDTLAKKLENGIRSWYEKSNVNKKDINSMVLAACELLVGLVNNGQFGPDNAANYLVNDKSRFIS